MSRTAYRWAWNTPVTPAGRKLILLYLASNSNDSGECNLTVREIVKATGVSRRVAISHLNALIDDGLVKRQAQYRKDGSQSENTYYLAFGNPFKHIRQSETREFAEDWEAVKGDF